MRTFAEVYEDVKTLSSDEIEKLQNYLEKIVMDVKRDEILEEIKKAKKEAANLPTYSDIKSIKNRFKKLA